MNISFLGMVSKPHVDIANNQDVLDSLNHGLEEAPGIFFVAASGCDEKYARRTQLQSWTP